MIDDVATVVPPLCRVCSVMLLSKGCVFEGVGSLYEVEHADPRSENCKERLYIIGITSTFLEETPSPPPPVVQIFFTGHTKAVGDVADGSSST